MALAIRDAIPTRAPSIGIRVGHPKPDPLRDEGSWLHATVAVRKGRKEGTGTNRRFGAEHRLLNDAGVVKLVGPPSPIQLFGKGTLFGSQGGLCGDGLVRWKGGVQLDQGMLERLQALASSTEKLASKAWQPEMQAPTEARKAAGACCSQDRSPKPPKASPREAWSHC